MQFSLPSSRKEMKDVCIQFDGGNCASVGPLSYIALPHCSLIYPATTWIRYFLECIFFLAVVNKAICIKIMDFTQINIEMIVIT